MAGPGIKNEKERLIEEILITNYEKYYRLAYGYVHNEADAMDIVQEGACRAIAAAEQLKYPRFADTWVYRIMINTAREFLRRNRREVTAGEELPEEGREDTYEETDLYRALQQLDEQKKPYKILFLDAPDEVLMRRYSETRRRHPISIAEGISTREAFAKERQILQPLKERANYTINTALLSTAQNKERVCDLFLKNGGAKSAMRLNILSFGFKFGIPPEADLVLDVRCLPNPFYVPELKHKTGLDQEVVDFVMGHPEAQELLHRYENFLDYALPLYVKEGKSQLTIAVGCTGGKHRSITFARKIAEFCEEKGYQPSTQHRDSAR